MKFVRLICTLFLLFNASNIFGQTLYTNACYIASEQRAYVLTAGGTVCSLGFMHCYESTSGNFILLTRTTSTPCTSCSFGGVTRTGVIVDFRVYQCPIDDYAFMLLIPFGIFGFFMLRNRGLKVVR